MSKTITIKDIAAIAGVSPATVSRHISGKIVIRDSTRKRIDEAVKKLNYQPNYFARGLVLKQTNTIGIIVPDLLNPYWANFLRGIDDVIAPDGKSSIVCNSDNNPEKERELLWLLKYKQADGVILVSGGLTEGDTRDFVSQGGHMILVGPAYRSLKVSTLRIDNIQGGFIATQHLLHLGHTRIAVIAADPSIPSSNYRIEGYRKSLTATGIEAKPEWVIQHGEFRFSEGYTAMQRLMCGDSPPSAVFAVNDVLAIGAISALIDAGISVPGQVAVVGFDGLEIGSWFHPRLTTMEVNPYAFGKKAADMLTARLESEGDEVEEVVWEPELLVRESCGAVQVQKQLDCPG
jgi:DNA-binding LacI/PurR family transcriptional regulator